MNELQLDRATIHYTRSGAGDPPLLLVHGFTCAHDDWRLQVARFERECTVVALDLRCHGASGGRAQDCTIETYGADVIALARHLALAPAVLIGHSMGCRVVLEACRQAPSQVAGLVLIDGSWLGEDPNAQRMLHDHIATIGGSAFSRELFDQALLPDTAEGRAILERAVRFAPDVALQLFPQMAGWETRTMQQALDAVRVPLLAIQSTNLNPQRQRVRLQPGQTTPWLDLVRKRVPHARIEIVPDAGHFTMLDAASACNELIAAFVNALR
jgi:pimeloyl-ACP methyl ester carboxylesterase